jgi:hypothetical protein
MKKNLLLAILMALTTGAVLAQTPRPAGREYVAQGYAFAGPAAFTTDDDTLITYGVGGEGLLAGKLGVGAELAGFARRGRLDYHYGTLSPNVSYHFLGAGPSRKFDPFVTGGYSLFFARGVASGFNAGGGVNYWFKERVGLRVEVRDHMVIPSDGFNIVSVRFGISFR